MNVFKKDFSILLVALCLGVFFFVFSSCGQNPNDDLNNKILTAINNNSTNNIDEDEWNNITIFIESNKAKYPTLLDANGKVDAKKIRDKINEVASRRRNKQLPEIFNPDSKTTSLSKPTVKVFIENSGSMDGYIRGMSEFKGALSDLLVQIQYQFDKNNLRVNFINSKPYRSEVLDVRDFIDKLEPHKTPYDVGDRTTSELNQVLKIILDSTQQDNISILISDCIYSLNKNKSTEAALDFEKSLTKSAFLEKSKQFEFATVVLKMKSKFDGKYWKKDNSFEYLPGLNRPYYIWIIGSKNIVNEFTKKIKTQTLKGYENSYTLSNSIKDRQPYFTILKETNKIGSFKQSDRHQVEVRSIEDIKYNNGQLQFSIAIDLSGVPVDTSYLTDARNYIVPSAFKVISVEKIDRNKLAPRDILIVEKTPATHIITVVASDKFPIQDLKLELSNQIPAWVSQSNSTDDINIKSQLDSTFGIDYLIRGVSEAYTLQNPEQKSYFAIAIPIVKEKTSGSPLLKIFITILIIAVILFIIIIAIKRKNEN